MGECHQDLLFTNRQEGYRMKKLLLLAPLLVGCTNAGMGSINWSNPGVADSYTCEEVADPANYCATGEHPNLCDC
jgi:hypothetical protein